MGLLRFIFKYGPGSPGSIAKAMARSYVMIKRQNPEASEQELLKAVFVSRVEAAKAFGRVDHYGYSVEPNHVAKVIRNSKDLFGLTMHVVRSESPQARDRSMPWNVQQDLVCAVEETLEKRAPDRFKVPLFDDDDSSLEW